MPEFLRAYIVVFTIALAVFFMIRRAATNIIGHRDFVRWRNVWLAITTVGFLAGNFWIVMVISAGFVLALSRSEPVKPALFMLFVCALPMAGAQISGLGVINYFFELDFPLLLSLIVLLPAWLAAGRAKRYGVTLSDRLILAYYLLLVLLYLRETSLTDTLRQAFMLFLTMLAPYFVFSRTIRKQEDLQRVMIAFIVPLFVFSIIGAFEAVKHWLLYSNIEQRWNLPGVGSYLSRADFLRAVGPFNGPIVFGYVIMIALGFFLPFANRLSNRQRNLGFGALGLGLLSTLSRGPWLGAAAMIFAYISSGPSALTRLARYGILAMLVLAALAATPVGEKFINLLPFIGSDQEQTISYRQRLFENSMVVIKRNPLLGSVNYLEAPEMQELVQGQGIIDVVNSYIQVALETGIIGLGLFCGFFSAVLLGLRRALKRLPFEEEDLRTTGRALFATQFGILITIATVSSIGQIPILYWTVAGLAVAQTRIIRQRQLETAAITAHEWGNAA